MASDPGQRNPWGEGGSNRPPGAPPPPEGPWGEGPRRPGGGPRRPVPPDIEAILARLHSAFWRRFGGGPRPALPSGGRAVLLVVLLAVVLWLGSGFYRVEPDEQGVVLRFGAFSRLTMPGLNYHLPWPIEVAYTPAVTRINRTEIGSRTAVTANGQEETGRTLPEGSLMLTGDENIVDIDLVLLWRIDNAVNYLFNTRDPDVTVKAVAESVLREVMGRTPIQPALGPMRAQIAADVMDQTQRILNGYRAGVEITQVLLQKVDPPAAVIESFRDVQRANTDAERMRNEAEAYANDIVPRARGDAARLVAAGQGDKQAALAQATGETKRFLAVLAAYRTAKDVTVQRMYLDTMRDVLMHSPSVIVDDRIKGLLPLLQLGASPPSAGEPPAAPPTKVAPAPTAAAGAAQ